MTATRESKQHQGQGYSWKIEALSRNPDPQTIRNVGFPSMLRSPSSKNQIIESTYFKTVHCLTVNNFELLSRHIDRLVLHRQSPIRTHILFDKSENFNREKFLHVELDCSMLGLYDVCTA